MKKLWGVYSFFKNYLSLIKLIAALCFLLLISQITTSSIYTIEEQPDIQLPKLKVENAGYSFISRQLNLKTNIPIRPRSAASEYQVKSEDSISSIAQKFKLTPETILFANQKLEDDVHNLRSEMVLIIPPVDGIYHAWKPGDTLEKVSKQFDAQQEDITNFAGNKLDFASMYVEAGTMIMIPGGTRDINRWQSMIIIDQRPDPGQNANDCRSIENPIATSLTWPKDQYYIFGNEYSPGHLGLDIQADEGEPIYPVGSGIVTHAASGWNYGYGNVVQVDHGNGYVTVYAFLRSYNVSRCDIVNQGDMIGRAGVSEFSPYTYFHFEIRSRGSIVNPYEIIQ